MRSILRRRGTARPAALVAAGLGVAAVVVFTALPATEVSDPSEATVPPTTAQRESSSRSSTPSHDRTVNTPSPTTTDGGLGWRLLGFSGDAGRFGLAGTDIPAIVSEAADIVPAEPALGVDLSSVDIRTELVVVLPVPGRNGCREYRLVDVTGHQDFEPNFIDATIRWELVSDGCWQVRYFEAFVIAVDRAFWSGDQITVLSTVIAPEGTAWETVSFEETVTLGPITWEPTYLIASSGPEEGTAATYEPPEVRITGPRGINWVGPLREELAQQPVINPSPGDWTVEASVDGGSTSCTETFALVEHHSAEVSIVVTPDGCRIVSADVPPSLPSRPFP